jgi:hypothetical protein
LPVKGTLRPRHLSIPSYEEEVAGLTWLADLQQVIVIVPGTTVHL